MGYAGLIVPVYPEDRTWEKVAGLCITAYALVVLTLAIAPHRTRIWAWCVDFRNSLRPEPSKPDDEAQARERRIRDECEKRRVERFRFLVILNCFTLFISAPSYFMDLSANKITLADSICLQVHTLGKVTTALFAGRLLPRAVDAFYCFHILGVVLWLVSQEPSVEAIVQVRAPVVSSLLYWGVASLRPWMNGLGFLLAATADCSMLVLAGGASSEANGFFAYPTGFALLVGIDYCLKKSVRMEILAGDSENELEAIKTLLDTICDVIVHLDGRLRLKQHSAKLSDVLMIRTTSRSLKGQDLRSYMATEADSAIFMHHLQGSGAALAHASVFHAKMRDNAGSNIDMEFFSVGFRGRDGDQHHILGMREFTDIRPVLPAGANQAGANRAAGTLPPPPPPPFEPDEEPESPRERVEVCVGLGTPAVLEQGDIRSHRSLSSFESGSESGDVGTATPGLIETSEAAKVITINYLLASWAIAPPPGACCPKHTAISRLGDLLSRMRRKAPCNAEFGNSGWQCTRCGIVDEVYKDRKHRRRCSLCKDLSDEIISRGRCNRASL